MPVTSIRVVGNAILPEPEIRDVIARYASRELSDVDMEALRGELTELYVARGFITSGAVLPDQDFADGVLVVQLIEGRIRNVDVAGTERLRPRHVARQLVPDPGDPVEVRSLEARLQRLQADPWIRSVHAELRPGAQLGESDLLVRVEERRPYRLQLGGSNHRSPSIREWNGSAASDFANALGIGDVVSVRGEFGEGLRDVTANLTVPVTPYDTRLRLRTRWSRSEVVEAPFDSLEIESRFFAGGVELDHPVWWTRSSELRVGLGFEWRRGQNEVDGIDFSFSEGASAGETTVAPIRLFADWQQRSRTQVFGLRTQLSQGLFILGASDVQGTSEDGRFTSVLLQGVWARRFEHLRGAETITRASFQWAESPLLPLEQFSIGGRFTTRGYRENTAVRDSGAAASFEARVPLLRRPNGRSQLELAGFVDAAHAWNNDRRGERDALTLVSVGAGLRAQPTPWMRGELYWGWPLKNRSDEDDTAQDLGLHLRVTFELPDVDS